MVFTIYGHGGLLGHVTWIIYINFRSPFLRMLHMKFGPVVSEEKIFEIVDGLQLWTDGRHCGDKFVVNTQHNTPVNPG